MIASSEGMDTVKKVRLVLSIVTGVALGFGLHQLRSFSQCSETIVFSLEADKWLDQLMQSASSACGDDCIEVSTKKSGEKIVIVKERSTWETKVPINTSPDMRYHVDFHFRTVSDDLNLPVQSAIRLDGLNSDGRVIAKNTPRVGNWQPRKGWADWKNVIPLVGELYQRTSFSEDVSKLQLLMTFNVLGSDSQTEIESLEVKATDKTCGGN